MALFKNHTLPLNKLLALIPQELFAQISQATNVDYYAKVLSGKLMFNLLFFAILTLDKMGQRGIADLFSSPQFRLLMEEELDKKQISHSSISERLSVINADFFKQFYECILSEYSRYFPAKTLAGLRLERVDSSLVLETSNKLSEGMTVSNGFKSRKMVKYTINFDGMYGTCATVHTESHYQNESVALPENVLEHFKQTQDHASVYIFDRGQSSANAFSEMNAQKGLKFVGRLLENRRLNVVREFDCHYKKFSCGELKQDCLAQLYKKVEKEGKNGKMFRHQVLEESVFRVIRFRPEGKSEDILLITNILNLRAETIAAMYRRRWDIEVFFRFIKQELNFSHFVSLNINGIQTILYMTLIVAMLLMIYKQVNGTGFKTAKRRMEIELQELIIAIAVVKSGGDLTKMNLPAP
ncbi:hypothetical protein FACS1894178_5770 [Bacteroidia bacterium]|nr:hypothetical protein FACS1894178_5770 [Bacteroidia bacterium]